MAKPEKKKPRSGDDETDSGKADPVAAALSSLLTNKGGDAMGVANQLLAENFKLREKNRLLREDRDELTDKVPADGAVVLTAEDAKLWAVYQALGSADDLKTSLAERDKLKTDLAQATRQQALFSVAQAAGYNPKVLATLAGDAEFETKELEHEGKKISQVSVKIKEGENFVLKSLAEYAAANWAEFMPALKAGTPSNGGNGGNGGGTPFIQQMSGGVPPGSGGGTDMVTARLAQQSEARKAAHNPLMGPSAK